MSEAAIGRLERRLSEAARPDLPPLRRDDPVLLPGATIGSMTDRVCALVLRERAFRWWWIAMVPSVLLSGLFVVATVYLFWAGVGIWGIDWPVAWGFAILNYVWWIAIASGGTFISALFFLVRVEWRTSINRIAESMMLFGAAAAGVFPILHLGRPWFAYWLFFYPNTMGLWPQFRSPLLWDFWALYTYVFASLLFWYFGVIPDLASVRDRATTRWRQRVYGFCAVGFRGSGRQWKHYHATYGIMAAVMAPVVVSIHSIVGLDFAGGATVGWHSTEFPPLFVFGALLSGFSVVLLLIIPLRRLMRLEAFITGRHIDVLCKLLLTSSLLIGYGYVMDVFTTYYGSDPAEKAMFADRLYGIYWPVYWGTILFNVTLPQLLWFPPLRMRTPIVVMIAFGVLIGTWLERFEIVVTSLHKTHLPSAWGVFTPTFWDWATLAGTVGLFLTGILLALRFVPAVSMHEMRALIAKRQSA